MSKNQTLYMKGMNISASDGDDSDLNNMWDDRKLNEAYDRAIRIANAEVARRVAQSTNTQECNKGDKKKPNQPKLPKEGSSHLTDGTTATKWKVGMPCRAIYEDDGLEYEAVIAKIVSKEECIVQFLGYDNREKVKIILLKPTQGKEVRKLQIEAANDEGESASSAANYDDMDIENERPTSPKSTERSSQPKKKSSKKKSTRRINNFEFPDIPMPDFNMMNNLGSAEMAMPPPPPISMTSHGVDSQEQVVSSMLISYYMSGYYAGMYQGMKRGKDLSRRRNY